MANNCRNASDAQEVTQDVFIAAFRGLARFDVDRSFATWLFTIARRKCIDHHRLARPVTGDALPEEADDNSPVEVMAQREAERSIWQLAKHVLPPLQFDALWLRCAEDMSVAYVARVLGRTQTHVKVLLFRARIRLDAELAKQSAAADAAPAEGDRVLSTPQAPRSTVQLARAATSVQTGVQT